MTMVMYDTVTVAEVPNFANTSSDAVAEYLDGLYANQAAMRAKYPLAHHLGIAVRYTDAGRCLDVEPGDATNAEAVVWWFRSADHSQGKPIFYTSASNVSALINALAGHGVARDQYLIWSAHYTNEHICGPGTCGYPQVDGTQWTDHALGRNLDQSLINDGWFAPINPPKPPVDPRHYERYQLGPFPYKQGAVLNERFIVKRYDTLRARPWRQRWQRRKEIKGLRAQCQFLADRIAFVAQHSGSPAWGDGDWTSFHRQWRYDHLLLRAKGKAVK